MWFNADVTYIGPLNSSFVHCAAQLPTTVTSDRPGGSSNPTLPINMTAASLGLSLLV